MTGCGADPGTANTEGVAFDRSASKVNQPAPETAGQKSTAPQGNRDPNGGPGQAAPGGVDPMLTAGETARSQLPGTVVTIDFEQSAWEVTVVTSDGSEHDVVLSSAGDEVVAGPFDDREDAEDLSENRAMVQAATLTYAKAAQIAHDASAGGALHDLDLEFEYGQATWEASYHSVAGEPERTVIIADDGEIIFDGADD